MALKISNDAKARINLLAGKLRLISMDDETRMIPAAIFNHAMNMNCIDACEKPAEFDMEYYADNGSVTDFYWQRIEKSSGRVSMVGGLNCHSQWFRDYVANKITMAEIYIEQRKRGDDTRNLPLQWSFNT